VVPVDDEALTCRIVHVCCAVGDQNSVVDAGNDHPEQSEGELVEGLAEDVAEADCGYGLRCPVDRDQVLILIAVVSKGMAVDPRVLTWVTSPIDAKPEARKQMNQKEYDNSKFSKSNKRMPNLQLIHQINLNKINSPQHLHQLNQLKNRICLMQ